MVIVAAPEAGIVVGVIDKIEGIGEAVAVTVRSTTCEVPPPGAGVVTPTLIVPGVETSPGFTIVVSVDGPRKIVCRGEPLKVIVELGANPEPVTDNVNVTEFSGTLEGDRELTTGTGRLITPPQDASKISVDTRIPAEILSRRVNSSVLSYRALHRVLGGASVVSADASATRKTTRDGSIEQSGCLVILRVWPVG